MIRVVRIFIAPGSPTGRYSVEEEYPTMQTLYTGDELAKAIEAIGMDDAEAALRERYMREENPDMRYRLMVNRR